MNYYVLKSSANPSKIGRRFPQVEKIVDREAYPFESAQSISKFNPWGRLPDDLVVPEYELHSSAKLTDLISSGGQHSDILIISEKSHDLIKGFDLPPYQSYETKIYAKNEPYIYYVFFIPQNSYELIDFEKSEFALYPMNAMKIRHKSLNINSIADYEKCIKEHPFLVKENPARLKVAIDKLVLIDDIPFDLFRIIGPISTMYSYFVSERLKTAMEENKCTGMDFERLEDIQF
jgi:hypothetical protein